MGAKGIRFSLALLLLAVTLAYSNHFHNSFHYDDYHTVKDNPYIRSLKNTARFFTDTSAFSIRPKLRTYRPVVTLSLAADYWLGGGLKLFYFHLDMFLWYLAQLALMFALFRHILRFAATEPWTDWAALFAVALYGLHPAMAETVNYIIQRGDLYSTALVIAALAIYALAPRLRPFGVYLIPLAVALLTKPPAAIFPAILFAYVFLFEEPRVAKALQRCIPSLVVVAALLWLQARMTPASYEPGITPYAGYIATQPWVALHYFLMFFAPVGLTAAPDQREFNTIFCVEGITGLMFVLALIWAMIAAAKRPTLRPAAFGLAWFLLALIPTSFYRLFEVENDHRMFFPFVGLALTVSWCAALALRAARVRAPALLAAALLILAACAWGTHQRNAVWRDEDSLWKDAAAKSPRSRVALTSYGRTLMANGQPAAALGYFERALGSSPNYPMLETNLGEAYAALRLEGSAEEHFQRGIQLAPADAEPSFYYGRWLRTKGRLPEAMAQFRSSIANSGDFMEPRHALMQAYLDSGEPDDAKSLAADTLRISPHDIVALGFLNGRAQARSSSDDTNDGQAQVPTVLSAEADAQEAPSVDNYMRLSGAYFHAGRFRDSVRAAEEALKLRPGFAPAYNNMAAGHTELGEWDEAIDAAEEAVRLDPDYQLAWDNLERAERLKKQAAEKKQ